MTDAFGDVRLEPDLPRRRSLTRRRRSFRQALEHVEAGLVLEGEQGTARARSGSTAGVLRRVVARCRLPSQHHQSSIRASPCGACWSDPYLGFGFAGLGHCVFAAR